MARETLVKRENAVALWENARMINQSHTSVGGTVGERWPVNDVDERM